MKHAQSQALFARAQARIPGGVNSPVRAFRGVGGDPVFFKEGSGAWLTDVDGNRYVDLVGSWGPLILGHAYPPIVEAIVEAARRGTTFGAPVAAEVEFAELLCATVPSVEKVRLVSSGTEATVAAVRVARGFTGRDSILKFEGCFHGAGDPFLVKAGSGVETLGLPDSPGVPSALASLTLTAPFNDLEAVERIFNEKGKDIACAIIEPVVGNMGVLVPRPGFLEGLQKLCQKHGVLFVLDEVMTGFRLARGGAQELYGLKPDLSTFAKVVGGGMPLGAYGGRRDIMSKVAPEGPVYQSGTLSGNPVAVAAGLACVKALAAPGTYARLEQLGLLLEEGFRAEAKAAGVPVTVNRVGSMITVFFTSEPVFDYASAKKADTAKFGRFFHAMLQEGVYLPPSQFEAAFISLAIGEPEVAHVLAAARKAFRALGDAP
ncbi:glutamate-1-semialdehyde 2,1-aminomutase [Corallococcus exiguus]|uniref:glutamate-1-semialdehyde 2,1-aminomutase n=1 Tax=Corallococcus TaxID=83461 RepID=UPI000EC3418D|nr:MULTISPECIES: glutamate-1-semialdehyde 2,1-aminomutase [Corallococcus]NNB85099.1 glutamate-1-semialdehyde 2,1-aminomutase [Corallococcus exiguus]NNB98953.1 glutamate-1-semialdehyde 2,1-aminomutase [Corallococcus exiguus]NNC06525.1 glutamate-1-semialdehyde 2,1-aminomutase [Corallococcus exiguus]NPC50962.1 glutamate-1-semialdehyde 2,1-aminomutase [Corallococcus exiguus]RKH75970.1 glutamate-1-semialdehyde-2,1-aminomutase [Corallococcus sp. AB032C]